MKMHFSFYFIFFFFLFSCYCDSPIEHVVVLMMENRSFDHMLGWLHDINNEIDGLTGNEWNSLNSQDPLSPRIYVNKNGFDISPSDPNHDLPSTTEEIFGYYKPNNETGIPKMNGFVQNSYESNLNTTTVMSMFTKDSDSANVINNLALEYVTFDKWYASIPGPTDPNRAYAMSGTSNGVDTNFNGTLWNQQSYFDFLSQHNITWNGYYQEDPWALFYFEDTSSPPNSLNMKEMKHFFQDVTNNNLSQFSFLQPQMNTHKTPPNWQHPDASVREGDRLIKAVYETLRNSSYWESLAFIVTYDEHGGFYDHVTPPQYGIPSPDGVIAPDGFTFERLGVRVPTVLISPWVSQGYVEHKASGPTLTSEYDHTSIMATCNKIFGINDHLSARSAWAGTFEHLFLQNTSPRKDCIQSFPDIKPWTLEDLQKQWVKPLNDHLKIQIKFYCIQNKRNLETCGRGITNQLEASLFIEKELEYYLNTI